MTLRLRLSIMMAAVVAVAIWFAWGTASSTAVEPLALQVAQQRIATVVRVANQLDRGIPLSEIDYDEELKLEISDRPPVGPSEIGPNKEWQRRMIRRRPILINTGALQLVIRLENGWLIATSDSQSPSQNLGLLTLGLGAVMVAITFWVTSLATRPLQIAETAMRQVESGDLSHRLSTTGGAELSAMAEAFNNMASRVEGMLKTEKQMMAGISHELRTPLSRLRLQTEMLRDDGVSATRLDRMESDLHELDTLIAEFLEISRLEIGEAVLNREPTSAMELVNDIHRNHRAPDSLLISGIDFRANLDRARVTRAVTNLIQNAEKHAPKGELVEVVLGRGKITVSDRGPGVPTPELTRLFEPFFRGTARNHSKGFGLGLSIVRQVASLHGGAVQAVNREGGGLSVTITFTEVI